VIVHQIGPYFRRIRQEAWEPDLGRIMGGRSSALDVGTVRIGKTYVQEEWLPGGQFVEERFELGVLVRRVEIKAGVEVVPLMDLPECAGEIAPLL
jgi:hypothetical protein